MEQRVVCLRRAREASLNLLSLWFGLREPVSRRAYAASGFLLMALK
jgi:hypothetical protein